MSQGERPAGSARWQAAGSGAFGTDDGARGERLRHPHTAPGTGETAGAGPPTAKGSGEGRPDDTTVTPHPPERARGQVAGTAAANGPPERRDGQPPAAPWRDGGTVSEAFADAPRRRPGTGRVPRWRKARMRISKADPWSVMMTSFLVSTGLGLCVIVAVSAVTMMMSVLGQEPVLSLGWELTLALTVAVVAVEVALATALATLAAFLFNWSSGFAGGVEVTLAEDLPPRQETGPDSAPDQQR
ncbi:DUF3566 domain-containing protein [Streptomyces sp. NPDC046931]|uniref:DUF3566 domain-containing protein n=1 Tax=Streptomyces sp. NPDC046931 TaxID=3154806 RepID=UPI0033ED0253